MTSCSSSLVYSPSLQLDNKQLEKDEVSLSGNISTMPETRPNSFIDLGDPNGKPEKASLGFDGRIGYGFSNSFNLEGRAWVDDEINRGGLALSSAFYFNENERLSYFFKPVIGIVIGDGSYEGMGLELPIGIVYDLSEKFYNYTGIGLAYGLRDTEVAENGNRQVGLGLLGHIGFGYNLNKVVSVKAELTPIQQYNFYNEVDHFIVSAAFGLSLKF